MSKKIQNAYHACLPLKYDRMKTQSSILILTNQQPEIIENDLIERYIYNSWAFEG